MLLYLSMFGVFFFSPCYLSYWVPLRKEASPFFLHISFLCYRVCFLWIEWGKGVFKQGYWKGKIKVKNFYAMRLAQNTLFPLDWNIDPILSLETSTPSFTNSRPGQLEKSIAMPMRLHLISLFPMEEFPFLPYLLGIEPNQWPQTSDSFIFVPAFVFSQEKKKKSHKTRFWS